MAKGVKTPQFGVPKQRSNTPLILGAIGVVVVLGLIAVMAASLTGDDEDVAATDVAQFRTIAVEGSPLTPAPSSGGADPAVGSPAPVVRGETFDGTPYAIEDNGRPQVITFYAHWCPHCQAELPGISQWLQTNRDRYPNVDFHAVATGTNRSRPNYPPSEWFAKEGYPLPVLVDDRSTSAAGAFGLASYPYFVALDADHNVAARTSGEIGVDGFEQLVQAVTPPA